MEPNDYLPILEEAVQDVLESLRPSDALASGGRGRVLRGGGSRVERSGAGTGDRASETDVERDSAPVEEFEFE